MENISGRYSSKWSIAPLSDCERVLIHRASSVALLCPAWLHLLFLFPGLLSTLCTLIAPLPYPHKDSRPLCRGCQIAHKPLANEVSQPPGEVGRIGFVIRIIVEANRVVSS